MEKAVLWCRHPSVQLILVLLLWVTACVPKVPLSTGHQLITQTHTNQMTIQTSGQFIVASQPSRCSCVWTGWGPQSIAPTVSTPALSTKAALFQGSTNKEAYVNVKLLSHKVKKASTLTLFGGSHWLLSLLGFTGSALSYAKSQICDETMERNLKGEGGKKHNSHQLSHSTGNLFLLVGPFVIEISAFLHLQ